MLSFKDPVKKNKKKKIVAAILWYYNQTKEYFANREKAPFLSSHKDFFFFSLLKRFG